MVPRGGERELFDRVRLREIEQLERGIVLGVDRYQDSLGIVRGTAKDFARRDHAFLVGQSDDRTALKGCERGSKTRRADDGGHHHFRGLQGGFENCILAGKNFDAGADKGVRQRHPQRGIADDCRPRTELARLRGKKVHIPLCRERLKREGVRPIMRARKAHHIERRRTDRTGAPQNRDAPVKHRSKVEIDARGNKRSVHGSGP